jgi:hypothetical protein
VKDCNDVKQGMQVVTAHELGDTRSMLIAERYLKARRPDANGMIQGFVPGHGGDVWWVRHDDGEVAAYSYTEFSQGGKK